MASRRVERVMLTVVVNLEPPERCLGAIITPGRVRPHPRLLSNERWSGRVQSGSGEAHIGAGVAQTGALACPDSESIGFERSETSPPGPIGVCWRDRRDDG